MAMLDENIKEIPVREEKKIADMESLIRALYGKLTRTLIARGLTITTMESCTAGQIISLITDTEGSSAVVKGASVTYSNEAKMLEGVSKEIIETYGVYSEETAIAMAQACRRKYGSHIGVGITGTFGNVDPENRDSVPGQVYFAVDTDGEGNVFSKELEAQPTRYAYKLAVAKAVVDVLLRMLK